MRMELQKQKTGSLPTKEQGMDDWMVLVQMVEEADGQIAIE